ncbi:capsid cement protein [Gordonia sp. NPDC062954]|uniref:capsid cement protein n=1 Tax=Gordonia sp. NPDC062954 TaxID=3364003 RepID=UPI0037C57229
MPNLDVTVYEGRDLTARATATITTSRFVKISGNLADGDVAAVAPADAGGRIAGVAKYGGATGELVGLARGNARVVRVTAGESIAAFAEVEVGASAKAVTKSTGVAVGYALTAATADTDALISLY